MPVLKRAAILLTIWNMFVLTGFGQSANKTATPDTAEEAYVVEEHSERWDFENDGTGQRQISARIRIQSEAALQSFGVLSFPYQKAFETLQIQSVRVRKADGNTVVTPPDEIEDMPTEVSRAAPFYSDLREKHLAVKSLAAGDVLEFTVQWQRTGALAPGQFWTELANSDQEIVLKRKVQVSIPRARKLLFKGPAAPVVREENGRRLYTWESSNLQRRKPDQAALQQAQLGRLPPPDLEISSFQSWEEVGRWYDELQRERVAPSAEIRAKAAELTRNAADDDAKVAAIYKYVSTEFHYIGVSFGLGRYQPHFAAEILSNQYGDCKDKHTLLASLLGAAGIRAYPVLVNASRVIDQDVPNPGQFDHLITMVDMGQRKIWLDATTEVAPPGYLPPQLRDKEVLVIFPNKAGFVRTPKELPFPSEWKFSIKAKVDAAGVLDGKVEQSHRGDLEFALRSGLRRTPRAQWKDLIQSVSYAVGFAGDVSDLIIPGAEKNDGPLRFSYSYKRKDYPNWKDHQISLPAPRVKWPAPDDDDKDVSLSYIWLGVPTTFEFDAIVQVPSGFVPQLPMKKDILEDFAEYHATYAVEGGALAGHYRILIKQYEITRKDFAAYKKFLETMFEDREQYISFSSGGPLSPAETIARFQQKILELPDSKNEAALASERDARDALRQGSVDGAISACKRAVEQDPQFTRAWIFLGQLYMISRQTDAALDAIRKAVAASPKEPLVYKTLAFTLFSEGKQKEAIDTLLQLEKIAPDDNDVTSNLGSFLVQAKRYKEAIPYLEKSVKTYPANQGLMFSLGSAYLHSGEGARAAGIFDDLLKSHPNSGLKNNIAYEFAVANQNLEDALRYAQEAVAEEEEDSAKVNLATLTREDLWHTSRIASYWDTLGWVYFRKGDLKGAEDYLHAAWLLTQDPVIAEHLGEVYEKENRKSDAAHIYRLASDPLGARSTDRSVMEEMQERLKHLPPEPKGSGPIPRPWAGDELSKMRSTALPRLVKETASADFFLLFGPGPKVEDTKFVSGSDQLRTAGKGLSEARYKIAFPANSKARILRRGLVTCYPTTGCSFTFLLPRDVQTVQ